MGGISASLSVQIASDPDSDEAEVYRLSRELRRELLRLNVDDVVRAADAHPPAGTKAGGTSLADVLIVSVSNSTVIVAMIQLLRGWINRGNGRRVKLKIGKNGIDVGSASPEEQARLIESWIDWHEKK